MNRAELLAEIKKTLSEMKSNFNDAKEGQCGDIASQLEDAAQDLLIHYETLRQDYELELIHRQAAEKESIDRQRYLETIYNSFDLAIFIIRVVDEKDFIFESINPTHERLTGLQNRNIAGKKAAEFVPEVVAQAVEINYRRCVEMRSTIEYEEMIPFDGRETWWMTRLIPIMDESGIIIKIIGYSIHMTNLKKMEQIASEYASFMNTLLDTIPIPIFYKDRSLHYIGCNRSFEHFLGTTKEHILGKTVFELSSNELAAEYDQKDKELLSTKSTQRYQSKVTSRDGTVKDVIFTKEVYFNSDGSVGGIIGTINDISERIAAEELLKDLSLKDELTGLYNRRGINQILPAEFNRSINNTKPISVLMLDIDHFKRFNDTYGHQKGDSCLRDVATAIKSALVRPDDRAGRYGGEEFIIILSNTDFEGAIVVAKRIKTAIARLGIPHQNNSAEAIVSVSIGVASKKPVQGDHFESLVKEADINLYAAKDKGRNRIEGYKTI